MGGAHVTPPFKVLLYIALSYVGESRRVFLIISNI